MIKINSVNMRKDIKCMLLKLLRWILNMKNKIISGVDCKRCFIIDVGSCKLLDDNLRCRKKYFGALEHILIFNFFIDLSFVNISLKRGEKNYFYNL